MKGFLDKILLERAEEQAWNARAELNAPKQASGSLAGKKSAAVRVPHSDERDLQIRRLVSKGINNCEIARRLKMDPSGVRRARKRLALPSSKAGRGRGVA